MFIRQIALSNVSHLGLCFLSFYIFLSFYRVPPASFGRTRHIYKPAYANWRPSLCLRARWPCTPGGHCNYPRFCWNVYVLLPAFGSCLQHWAMYGSLEKLKFVISSKNGDQTQTVIALYRLTYELFNECSRKF